MQPERQVAVALTGIGAACVIPQYAGMMRQPPAAPGGLLIAGALLGAIGTLFGSLLAIDHPARAARALGLAFWTLIGLGFAAAAGLALARSTTLGMRILCTAATVLPLFGPLAAVARSWRVRTG